MQGSYRHGREKHEKTRNKYIYVQLSDSSETVLDKGQGKCDADALFFSMDDWEETKDVAYLSYKWFGENRGRCKIYLLGRWLGRDGDEEGEGQGKGGLYPGNTCAWPHEVEGPQRPGRWQPDSTTVSKVNERIAQALRWFMVHSSWTLFYLLSRRWLPWSRSDRREMCQLLREPTSPLQHLVGFFQAWCSRLGSCGARSIYVFKYLALGRTDETGCGFTSILQMSTAAQKG